MGSNFARVGYSRAMFRFACAAALAIAVGCSSPPRPPPTKPVPEDVDPDGPNRAAVAAQVAPYLEGEILQSVVVGLYEAGRREIYGFGAGPGGKPPDGSTFYELGGATKIYTGLLLADAIQRREVALDTPVSELLPPGVTVPTAGKQSILLFHLAIHASGLPPYPRSVSPAAPDPFAKYGEEALYRDLIATQLVAPPGTQISYSTFGAGLLGFALGRKIGGGYQRAVETRVLGPLELRDTKFAVPTGRWAPGTNDDLKPVPAWSWNVLTGAGGLISTVRDQLKLVDAELDALTGGRGALRNQMRLTQENQLEGTDEFQALGWLVDSAGRYWHNGSTGGHRSFISFDPKHRRGIVILASGASSLVDRLGKTMQDVLDKSAKDPPALPTAAQLASYVGTYDLAGTKLAVVLDGKRLYLEGPGEPRHRMAPASPNEFWIEALQSLAVFQLDELPEKGGKVAQITFQVGGRQLIAPRVP